MNKKSICVVLAIVIIIVAVVVVNCVNGKDENKSSQKSNVSELNNENSKFSLKFKGVEIIPGTEFQEEKIEESATFSEITSCAFEGNDKIYTYSDVEITVAEIDGKDKVYSVYFINDNMQTNEGVKLSDSKDKMLEIYGNNFKNDISSKYTYVKGNVELSFVIENDVIVEIEYVLS